MRFFKNNVFATDAWAHVTDADPLPVNGYAIVSLKRWRAEQALLVSLGVPLGVKVDAGETLDAATDDLGRLTVIALAFPKFSDGRSYSKARCLREQFGFRGELRAVGEVLLDQIPLMLRCGFDAFEISNEPTQRALDRGHLPAIYETYQPTGLQNSAARRFAEAG